MLENEIRELLSSKGADFVYYVDVSGFTVEQNKGFKVAVLLGFAFSPEYLQKVTNTTEYVKNMIRNGLENEDEFNLKEQQADRLADEIAEFLKGKSYRAYSQSENNLSVTGNFDYVHKRSPLPHKIIAGLAGLGWIGKNNLMVTPQYGSAICMCSVLTDAPLQTVLLQPLESRCGDCTICVDICQVQALTGTPWNITTSREEIVDVHKCTTCLKCLVFCPWTQRYMKNN
jgi:epoxyqueuosine reductase